MNYEEQKAWLATLKVGDKVCMPSRSGWGGRTYTIYKIERVTATQFVSFKRNGLGVPCDEVRFRKKDGHIVGSDSYARIEPLTQDVLKANERASLESWLSGVNPKSLSAACLRAMKQAHDHNGGAA
jgi:hypothetical protein